MPNRLSKFLTPRRLMVWVLMGGVAWGLHHGQVVVDVLARMATIQAHEQVRPQQPVWVTPDNPFFRAGQMDTGHWSVVRMLEAWKQAGLTSEQAAEVLVFFHERLLPSVTDASVAEHQKQQWDKAQAQLKKALPQAWDALDNISPQDKVVPIDWAMSDGTEETMRWVELLGEIGAMAPSMTDLQLEVLTLEQARDAVKEAVRTSGLKKLNVPLAVWSDPTRLTDMASGLMQANRDLETITGWKGGVLGLDGRVSLTLGTIDSALVDGIQADGGRLEMESDWGELSHEWLHALDFVMARQTLAHPRFGTLTDHRQGWLRHWNPSPPTRAWWAAVDHMEASGKAWVTRRGKAVQQRMLARRTDMKGYWTDPTELLAFAWEARTRRLPGLELLGEKSAPMENDHANLIAPKPTELAGMEPGWEPLLEGARVVLGFERQAPALQLPVSADNRNVPALSEP